MSAAEKALLPWMSARFIFDGKNAHVAFWIEGLGDVIGSPDDCRAFRGSLEDGELLVYSPLAGNYFAVSVKHE